ncbi:MAG: copper-binding protein [Thiohalocapsa sp.]
MSKEITFAALLTAVAAQPAIAQEQSMNPGAMHSGGMMDQNVMGMGGTMHGSDGAGAEGTGVIKRVDADAGVVNITHGPISSLNWPEMTMELPVTDEVDLSGVQPGDDVRFRVELGADNVYRMSAIEAAP